MNDTRSPFVFFSVFLCEKFKIVFKYICVKQTLQAGSMPNGGGGSPPRERRRKSRSRGRRRRRERSKSRDRGRREREAVRLRSAARPATPAPPLPPPPGTPSDVEMSEVEEEDPPEPAAKPEAKASAVAKAGASSEDSESAESETEEMDAVVDPSVTDVIWKGKSSKGGKPQKGDGKGKGSKGDKGKSRSHRSASPSRGGKGGKGKSHGLRSASPGKGGKGDKGKSRGRRYCTWCARPIWGGAQGWESHVQSEGHLTALLYGTEEGKRLGWDECKEKVSRQLYLLKQDRGASRAPSRGRSEKPPSPSEPPRGAKERRAFPALPEEERKKRQKRPPKDRDSAKQTWRDDEQGPRDPDPSGGGGPRAEKVLSALWERTLQTIGTWRY